ncbi:hypothetical protein IV62_GL000379 [Lactobacillus helveticus]|nr:hypothetical protein IV62_GL000379 [Lactobacillus helveticus]
MGLDHIAAYDGVIVAKMIFDKQMIDAAKNLKIISTYVLALIMLIQNMLRKREL